MNKISNKKRKTVLFILMLIECACFCVYVYTAVATSDYIFDMAFESITQPWLGDHTSEIASNYNVKLMETLMILGDCVLAGLLIINCVRFVFLKKLYKIFLGVSVGLLVLGCVIANLGGLGISIIFILVSIGFFFASHWIGNDYKDVEVVEETTTAT